MIVLLHYAARQELKEITFTFSQGNPCRTEGHVNLPESAAIVENLDALALHLLYKPAKVSCECTPYLKEWQLCLYTVVALRPLG